MHVANPLECCSLLDWRKFSIGLHAVDFCVPPSASITSTVPSFLESNQSNQSVRCVYIKYKIVANIYIHSTRYRIWCILIQLRESFLSPKCSYNPFWNSVYGKRWRHCMCSNKCVNGQPATPSFMTQNQHAPLRVVSLHRSATSWCGQTPPCRRVYITIVGASFPPWVSMICVLEGVAIKQFEADRTAIQTSCKSLKQSVPWLDAMAIILFANWPISLIHIVYLNALINVLVYDTNVQC